METKELKQWLHDLSSGSNQDILRLSLEYIEKLEAIIVKTSKVRGSVNLSDVGDYAEMRNMADKILSDIATEETPKL